MFFLLSKLLNFLFMPLTWVFIMLVLSFVFSKQAKRLRLLSLVVIMVFGNSFLLHEVNLLWEIPVLKDQNLNGKHIGVVLGGYAYYSPENDRITFRENGDRLFQGVRLLQQDYISDLVISGGSGYLLYPDQKEAIVVKDYLDDIGIADRHIIVESESRNTRENALYTLEKLKEAGRENEPVVLITSAYHMRRAKACFEAVGLTVIPYPSDPRTGERFFSPDHLFLPQTGALWYWNSLIHEWVGFASYWILGYI